FGLVILDVERRAVEDLPDAREVRLAVGRAGERLTGRLRANRRRGGAQHPRQQNSSDARHFSAAGARGAMMCFASRSPSKHAVSHGSSTGPAFFLNSTCAVHGLVKTRLSSLVTS